jgi:3-methyladenine DNA glycosylase AlkD
MTVKEIMQELRSKGSESIKKILLKHGAREPLFGVKIEDLKLVQKKIRKDYQLAKDLYDTENADAMYLAGLIADDQQMTKADLQGWVRQALSPALSEYIVPWVAAEGKHGYALAQLWINAPEEHIAAAGWATLSSLLALKEDAELDIDQLKSLLNRVVTDLPKAKNRVRHTMNGFVISAGVYVKPLTDFALATAARISKLPADPKGTASRLPDAAAYILKVKDKGTTGKKKKTVKC